MHYEDNIHLMYNNEAHNTNDFEVLANQNDSTTNVELCDTEFCVPAIKKFVGANNISKMHLSMFRSLNDNIKQQIKDCPSVLAIEHGNVIIVFHCCVYNSAHCTCVQFKRYRTFIHTLDFSELLNRKSITSLPFCILMCWNHLLNW